MKILITENQLEVLRERLSEILNERFAESSNIVCAIKVFNVDPEENDYIGLKFDIRINVNIDLFKTYNPSGVWGLSEGISKKISGFLNDWMGLEPNEYNLSISAQKCNKST